MTARGIHVHDRFKLGLDPHDKPKDELLQIRWAVDPASVAPTKVDHMTITPTLGRNDQIGDCGPVSAANITGIVSKYETGSEQMAPDDGIVTLYSESSNPPYNPQTGANDDGVQNPDLYAAWTKNGLAGLPGPIAYGELADTSDASIALAIDVFGAVTMAVDLETAQQSQSDGSNPIWDYSKSGEWGGHDICVAAIDSSTGLAECYSWALKVGMTEAFRKHQMLEVFVPVFQSVLLSNKFDATVNSDAMRSDLANLTGGKFVWPAAPTPTPQPTPTPTSDPLKVSDPIILQHISHAAGLKNPPILPQDELNRVLRSHFGIKS